MATIHIDGRPYTVEGERNMLAVALGLGFYLPYFCWHPALGSVGACRQCAVKQFKDEHDAKGAIVMACMTPAADGVRISITDPDAVAFRRGIIEGLMLHHPHDCPVCDEGGECHLQDMTVMTGHAYRRYRFQKRTFRNQYLGPFVAHEMNRCIQCYRCVRFYRGYAGGTDFNSFSINHTVYFGRDRDGVLESEFSGNLVEVCPTGVFVNRTLAQHYTRKWDQTFAPSICAACGLGCNISAGERYGLLRRIINRYHPEVNGYFLCDRGRFSYEFVNSEQRLRTALAGRGSAGAPLPAAAAIQRVAEVLSGADAVLGIGSPRASLEANFALRVLVGADNFYAGVAADEFRLWKLILETLQAGPGHVASLDEAAHCDAVLILGEDLTNTAARLALAVRQAAFQQPRQAVRQLRIPSWNDYGTRQAIGNAVGPVFIATPQPTKLDDVARRTYRAAPDEVARLGYAVAHAIHSAAPPVSGATPELEALAGTIAHDLMAAERPLVIAGSSLGSAHIIRAAANVVRALAQAGRQPAIAFAVPEANAMGLAMMCDAALERVAERPKAAIIVLENDLRRRLDETQFAQVIGAQRPLIVLDHLRTATVLEADLVLPAGTFAESDGTFVNNEGRAQRYFQVFVPAGDVQESWRWLRDVMAAVGRPEAGAWKGLDDVIGALARELPQFARVPDAAPPATLRLQGTRIPREPHRFSGRTAMHANVTVQEPKPPDDPDSPLSFSMEGYPQLPPPALIPFFWAPGWNSVRALNAYQSEAGAPLPSGPPPGVRLIAPGQESAYADGPPERFTARAGEFQFIALHHLFGSEEQTHWAPAIASLAPEAYVALTAGSGFADGDRVEVQIGTARLRVAVRILPGLPDGIAGLPVGLKDLPYVALPGWGRVSTVSP